MVVAFFFARSQKWQVVASLMLAFFLLPSFALADSLEIL